MNHLDNERATFTLVMSFNEDSVECTLIVLFTRQLSTTILRASRVSRSLRHALTQARSRTRSLSTADCMQRNLTLNFFLLIPRDNFLSSSPPLSRRHHHHHQYHHHHHHHDQLNSDSQAIKKRSIPSFERFRLKSSGISEMGNRRRDESL